MAKKRTHEDEAAAEAPAEAPDEAAAVEDEDIDPASDSEDLADITHRFRFQSAIVNQTDFDTEEEKSNFRVARQMQQQAGLVSAHKTQERAEPRINNSRRTRRKGTEYVSYFGQG